MRETPPDQRMFTFSSGGWVALAAGLVCIGLLVWAIGPAVMKTMQRPPGDGRTVESYGFNLSPLTIPRETFVPVMLHRDMVPVLTEPAVLTVEQADRLSDEERGKFLVSTDRVIGVTLNGQARAYPIQQMTVHELVNDTLGGTPIVVSYSWLGDVPRVFDRRVDGETIEFGISGLVTNANTLLYDRRPPEDDEDPVDWEDRGESLWRQFDGRAVSGPAAEDGRTLTPIHAQLVSWRQWRTMHPETTVLARDPALLKRYRRSSPDQYFRSADIPYPVDPLPPSDQATIDDVERQAPDLKDRIVAIRFGDEVQVYPYRTLIATARRQDNGRPDDLRTWRETIGDQKIAFTYDPRAETFAVEADAESEIQVVYCFWFLWYAHYPETEVMH